MRIALAALSAALLFGLAACDGSRSTETMPADLGVDEVQLSYFLNKITESGFDLNSIFLARDGKFLSVYRPPYAGEVEQDFYGITQTFVALAACMAADAGAIPSLDAPILPFFSSLGVPDPDGLKGKIRVRDLLAMESGIDWPEAAGEEDLVGLLRDSADWTKTILSRRMVAAPGERFNFSSADSQLLSAVVKAATGKDALAYLADRIAPILGDIGMSWKKNDAGEALAWTGLVMRPRAMVRLGELLAADLGGAGRLLKRGTLEALEADPVEIPADQGYLSGPFASHIWARPWGIEARGKYGQYLMIDPEKRLVALATGKIPAGEEPSFGALLESWMDGSFQRSVAPEENQPVTDGRHEVEDSVAQAFASFDPHSIKEAGFFTNTSMPKIPEHGYKIGANPLGIADFGFRLSAAGTPELYLDFQGAPADATRAIPAPFGGEWGKGLLPGFDKVAARLCVVDDANYVVDIVALARSERIILEVAGYGSHEAVIRMRLSALNRVFDIPATLIK